MLSKLPRSLTKVRFGGSIFPRAHPLNLIYRVKISLLTDEGESYYVFFFASNSRMVIIIGQEFPVSSNL